jgi:hypothetical protein
MKSWRSCLLNIPLKTQKTALNFCWSVLRTSAAPRRTAAELWIFAEQCSARARRGAGQLRSSEFLLSSAPHERGAAPDSCGGLNFWWAVLRTSAARRRTAAELWIFGELRLPWVYRSVKAQLEPHCHTELVEVHYVYRRVKSQLERHCHTELVEVHYVYQSVEVYKKVFTSFVSTS